MLRGVMRTFTVSIALIGVALISHPANADIGSFLAGAGNIGAGIEREQYERARRQQNLEMMRLCNEIIRLGGQCNMTQGIASTEDLSYEPATIINQIETGDISIKTCNYKTFKGYVFHVNYRGQCPYSVKVNPETNRVLSN